MRMRYINLHFTYLLTLLSRLSVLLDDRRRIPMLTVAEMTPVNEDHQYWWTKNWQLPVSGCVSQRLRMQCLM